MGTSAALPASLLGRAAGAVGRILGARRPYDVARSPRTILRWWMRALDASRRDVSDGLAVRWRRLEVAQAASTTLLVRHGLGRSIERWRVERPLDALSPDDWRHLRQIARGGWMVVELKEDDCFATTVGLPRSAWFDRQGSLLEALAQLAPIALDALVWTARRSATPGRADVVMCRRTTIEAIAKRFAAHGLSRPKFVAKVAGRPLPLRAAESRRTGGGAALLVTLVALLSIPVTIAAGAAWFGRDADALRSAGAGRLASAARDRRIAEDERRTRAPLVSRTMEAIARDLPDGVMLNRVVGGPGGRLTVEIDAPDPDQIRPLLRRAAAFRTLRETRQVVVDGGLRMTLESPR